MVCYAVATLYNAKEHVLQVMARALHWLQDTLTDPLGKVVNMQV